MKVVINACFGGFSLSPEATIELWRRGGPVEATPVAEYFGNRDPNEPLGKNASLAKWRGYQANPSRSLFITVFSPDESLVLYAGRAEENRSDPILVQLVEEMGADANGSCADLKIIEVPDGVEWEIEEYDGNEHVAEKHRTWG